MWCQCRLGALGKFRAPKIITIHDMRLGALYHTLRVCVLVYIIVSVFYSGEYRWSEKPDATPTFWFESGDLYEAQNYNWGGYCDNTDYNYNYRVNQSYWNDLDIECRAMHYGEMLMKTASDGFVMTFMKEETTSSRKCSPSEDVCLQKAAGDRISRQSRIRRWGGNTAVCTCAKLQDYFVHGAEEIEMHIEHGFLATEKMDVAGSSTYESIPEGEREKRKLIRTCLKKKGMKEDECFKEYGPGEAIYLRLADWMMLAGVSLDEHLKDTVTKDAKTGAFPYRRTVGTTLLFHLKYTGDAQDDEFTCDIEVHNKDGWTSYGSDVSYTSYESHQNMDFHDRYARGVNIQFLAMGQVTKFDYATLLNTLIGGLVLLGLVEQVVLFVAQYGLPESRVYLKAMSEPFKHAKAMAEFGVQAALACQAFYLWNQSGTQINERELMDVFRKGNLDDKIAQQFVRVIMNEARSQGDDGEGDDLSCTDLIHIMSSGLVSLDELARLEAKEEMELAKVRAKAEKKLVKLQEKAEKDEAKRLAKEEKKKAKVQNSVSPADESQDEEAKEETEDAKPQAKEEKKEEEEKEANGTSAAAAPPTAAAVAE
eukprot:gnl/MRDRNA2_/MRDRNA2_48229_c0_seq1.p1 gnl/MRDRNA2_/MRDRNA2_48229_c0~~gnl/MRDRNA2_/MRDRNA2_48229_c0_seq1.p1  ORF type:complete len:594 (+),score=128.63 gnl/MRDRNA2_/MRDRNA2_48229_c0_seq1:114-1895(+)